jgi:hypothetical protein
MLTKDQIIAFAAFLQSEKERHQEDIDMIEAKLAILKSLGVEPQGTAPWIETEDLYAACQPEPLAESYTPEEKRRVAEYKAASEKEDLDIYEEEPADGGSWMRAYISARTYSEEMIVHD